MKMMLLAAAAAISVAGMAPALAQTATDAHQGHRMAMEPMTRASITQKVQQHFAMIDTNRDGFVTQAEADTAKQAMQTKRASRMEQRRGQRFDKLDANNDGAISRQEYDSAHARHQQPAGKDGMRRMAGMRHKGGMAGMSGMMGRMFTMADLDKDGRVSLQEATQAALQHFDAADTNHDGTVTHDEMRAAHGRMMPGHPAR